MRCHALVYPDRSSAFTLYEDDGISNDYRHGKSARTTFTCNADAAGVSCAVAAPEGDAALIPARRSYTFKIHALRRPRRVEIDGLGAPLEETESGPGWWHDGDRFLHVRLPRQVGAARIAW